MPLDISQPGLSFVHVESGECSKTRDQFWP